MTAPDWNHDHAPADPRCPFCDQPSSYDPGSATVTLCDRCTKAKQEDHQ